MTENSSTNKFLCFKPSVKAFDPITFWWMLLLIWLKRNLSCDQHRLSVNTLLPVFCLKKGTYLKPFFFLRIRHSLCWNILRAGWDLVLFHRLYHWHQWWRTLYSWTDHLKKESSAVITRVSTFLRLVCMFRVKATGNPLFLHVLTVILHIISDYSITQVINYAQMCNQYAIRVWEGVFVWPKFLEHEHQLNDQERICEDLTKLKQFCNTHVYLLGWEGVVILMNVNFHDKSHIVWINCD